MRVYIIADTYRWHHCEKDHIIFMRLLEAYAILLKKSKKENAYHIFAVEMTEEEYISTLKNMKRNRPKSKLKLL